MPKRMRPCALAAMLNVLLCLATIPDAFSQTGVDGAGNVLTNSAVVKLVRAGFSEKAVIAIVRTRPARFDLSPDRLVELKKAGVGEKVILAMLARDGEAAAFASDEWEDDSFFGEGRSKNNSRRGNEPSSGGNAETNIFGSSGSSNSRSRSATGGAGSGGDTLSSGSASVRIVRPPVEPGGAPPKLERKPTLTNDSIAELVEAGFSEGTIVRRIEQSPVDFDVSPAKLSELRRRRVTEQVITAMKAAMGAEADSNKN